MILAFSFFLSLDEYFSDIFDDLSSPKQQVKLLKQLKGFAPN
jgi:hypothetical protein